jgi:hypothetical protein
MRWSPNVTPGQSHEALHSDVCTDKHEDSAPYRSGHSSEKQFPAKNLTALQVPIPPQQLHGKKMMGLIMLSKT